jgi:high-affinity iron transporter
MAVLAGLISPVGTASAQQASAQPVDLATRVNDTVFQARVALMAGDAASAETAIADARAAVADYQALLPASSPGLTRAVDRASAAVEAADEVALAKAAGEVRVGILVESFHATIAAVDASDADGASRWLLVREFSPATRLARPSADSSLALQSLRAGTITSEEAHAVVQADLLDTYQGQLDRALATIEEAGQPATRAEAIGSVAGYWSILSPAYAAQLGPDAAAVVEATVSVLTAATLDAAAPAALELTAALESFRAAPLSAEEQSGRARQLMLYIGLVPVEYGRGIRGGQVVADIEIQEAITFLDGAQAAFTDLRPSLNLQDPAAADRLSDQLAALDRTLAEANSRSAIAEPDAVEAQAGAVEETSRDLFPAEWLRAGGEADFDVGRLAAGADGGRRRRRAVRAGRVGPPRGVRHLRRGAGEAAAGVLAEPGQGDRAVVLAGRRRDGRPGQLISGEAPVPGGQPLAAALVRQLDEARQRLGAGSSASGAVIFNAASIVLPRGLEAILILASLLASMTGANRRLKRPLTVGATLALVVTAVLFVLARTVLLSLSEYGEKVEAIVSVVAIGVLLLVMNWFFHKVYWTKWIAKHHSRRA